MTDEFNFMDVNLEEVKDPEPLTAGDYPLAIKKVQANREKFYLQLMLVAADRPDAKPITYFLGFPQEGDEPSWANSKLLRIKKFREAFGLTEEEWNDRTFESWKDKQAIGMLELKNNGEYGMQNEVKGWLVQ